MRILALETTTARGSLALCWQDDVIAETWLASDRRTAQTLAPGMVELLARVHWPPASIELVALSNGPGSFTGLRIAVTAAKAFAYAVGARVVAVSTLEVLVQQLPATAARSWAVMNAQRGAWFAAEYARSADGCWGVERDCQIVERGNFLANLAPGTWLTGPVLRQPSLPLPAGLQIPELSRLNPAASTVGRMAWEAQKSDQVADLWSLSPRYYRPSYAEEKRSAQRRAGEP